MGLLTAGELAWMRPTQNRRFDLTATITRATGIEDGEGGQLPGTPTTFTSPCCRHPHKSAAGEEVVGGAIQGSGLWDITFPALTDIRLKDTIMIDGTTYEVINAYGPKSRETAHVMLCRER